MARTWLSIKVELLGGRGEDLWPYPGRRFAVGPSHTFAALADVINTAFARWDLGHINVFDLADGSMVSDEFTNSELAGAASGRINRSHDIAVTKVSRLVGPGEEFRFTFDLGDDWVHCCTVEEKVDPLEVLGVRPTAPLPYWGWGEIPDQYGRRSEDDDGEGPLPTRPSARHPMRGNTWPAAEETDPIDLAAIRGTVAVGNVDAFLDEVTGTEIHGVLQQVSLGLPMVLEAQREAGERITANVYNLLSLRAWPGDDVLAEDLLARLRHQPLSGLGVPADLGELVDAPSGDGIEGVYLNTATGELHVDFASGDADGPGEDVDVESGQWIELPKIPPEDRWQDMADFAAAQQDRRLRESLEQAASGRGAFKRFREALEREGVSLEWHVFATERAFGRMRAALAEDGLRIR